MRPERGSARIVDSARLVRNHLVMPFAQCEALPHPGPACRSAAVTDSASCSHHAALVAGIGGERERAGDLPRRRSSILTEPLVAEFETTPASGNDHADPAQVRPRLAEAAAASLDDIQAALLDAALGATRRPGLQRRARAAGKQRIEVKIPDVRSRVAAIELLLREGLGRPPQADEAASPRLPRTAEAVEKLGWNDMKLIFTTHFASEIAAVTEDGDAPLQQRVAALNKDQRQRLREALIQWPK